MRSSLIGIYSADHRLAESLAERIKQAFREVPFQRRSQYKHLADTLEPLTAQLPNDEMWKANNDLSELCWKAIEERYGSAFLLELMLADYRPGHIPTGTHWWIVDDIRTAKQANAIIRAGGVMLFIDYEGVNSMLDEILFVGELPPFETITASGLWRNIKAMLKQEGRFSPDAQDMREFDYHFRLWHPPTGVDISTFKSWMTLQTKTLPKSYK